jgi:hypothetical protein
MIKILLIGFRVKFFSFLLGFNETNFLDRFSKIFKTKISRKSVQWEPSGSTRTGGRMEEQTRQS